MDRLPRRLLMLFVGCSLILNWSEIPSALAQGVRAEYSVDLDCGDFGTQQRAQYELTRDPTDFHGLDRDGDGVACVMNPSPGWVMPVLFSSFGFTVGRYFGYRRRKGAKEVVPGFKGLFMYWDISYHHNDSGETTTSRVARFDEGSLMGLFAWWIAWFPTTLLRNHVLPISTTPAVLIAISTIMMVVLAYLVASRRKSWI